MKYRVSVLLLVLGSALSAQASAHSVITPTTGTSGARHQSFSITAPTEGEVACVEYRLEVPPEWKNAGGQIDRVRRDPLWDVAVERDEDGWIKSITWSGAEAPDYSFVRFDLIVSLPKLTGLQQIKIWQTYADGSVVGWVEDRTGDKVARPAAGLTLTEAEER
jgi:uncharacterized protein YcnI